MASVLVTSGVLEGEYFLLPDEPIVSIGRDDQCTLQLLDRTISRNHLQIRKGEEPSEFIAADYRSANGVEVNGMKISAPVSLNDGDLIRIGGTELMFLADNHPDAKSAQEVVRRKKEWKRSTLSGD